MKDSRIRAAERWVKEHRPEPLIVLAEMADGSQKEMTVSELERTGAFFVRVISGNSLKEVDRILATFPSVIR